MNYRSKKRVRKKEAPGGAGTSIKSLNCQIEVNSDVDIDMVTTQFQKRLEKQMSNQQLA